MTPALTPSLSIRILLSSNDDCSLCDSQVGAIMREAGEKIVQKSWSAMWQMLLLSASGLHASERFGNYLPHNLQLLLATAAMPHFRYMISSPTGKKIVLRGLK